MKINQTIIKDQKRIVNNITGAELQALAKELTVFEALHEYNDGNAYVDTTTALAYVLGNNQGLLEAHENNNANKELTANALKHTGTSTKTT